jgi:uncharacterized membrane protein (DUF485 family)
MEMHARKRAVLLCALVMWGLFMAFTLLTLFTPVLDGTVDGIGVAYIAGFVQVVLAMAAAMAYTRWANRLEAED